MQSEMQELVSPEQRKKSGGRSFDVEDVANVALFLAAFVGVWQLVYVLGIYPSAILPS